MVSCCNLGCTGFGSDSGCRFVPDNSPGRGSGDLTSQSGKALFLPASSRAKGEWFLLPGALYSAGGYGRHRKSGWCSRRNLPGRSRRNFLDVDLRPAGHGYEICRGDTCGALPGENLCRLDRRPDVCDACRHGKTVAASCAAVLSVWRHRILWRGKWGPGQCSHHRHE